MVVAFFLGSSFSWSQGYKNLLSGYRVAYMCVCAGKYTLWGLAPAVTNRQRSPIERNRAKSGGIAPIWADHEAMLRRALLLWALNVG